MDSRRVTRWGCGMTPETRPLRDENAIITSERQVLELARACLGHHGRERVAS